MPKKGFKHTEESKRKMSEAAKGRVPWNKGVKGAQVSWCKGKTLTDEHRANLSKARKKHSGPNKGKVFSPEYRQKLSDAHKGQIPWMSGREHTPEAKAKMSEAARRNAKYGEDNPCWKGTTKERTLLSSRIEYKAWRKFVFERDDYQCQECLKWGGELRAHHCKSWAEYPRLRFQTWNGLTLCKECHQRYHGGIG